MPGVESYKQDNSFGGLATSLDTLRSPTESTRTPPADVLGDRS